MKLHNKTKELYKEIRLTDEQSERILNNILSNKKEYKFKLIHLTPILGVFLIILIIGTFNIKKPENVSATEKKISTSTMAVEIYERERRKPKGGKYKVQVANVISVAINTEMNKNANLPSSKNNNFHSTKPEEHSRYKIKDLEKLLNVDLLESKYLKDYISHSETKKKDGKITKVQFETEQHSEEFDPISDSYEHKDSVSLYHWIMIMSDEYTKERDSYSYTGSKAYEYYLENLDTTAVIIEDTSITQYIGYTVRFDYKDVQYYYDFNIKKDLDTKKELQKILNSLK